MNEKTKKICKGQYLSDIMTSIPTDTILDKMLPGLGATTLELECHRDSIIIVPNVPVIKSKCAKYSQLQGVYENITTADICNYLSKPMKYHKIMTTPESFKKVKIAFERMGIDMYRQYSIILDEGHKVVEDVMYRKSIIDPIDDFFKFDTKAVISATPLEYSDPRFESFTKLRIVPDYDYQQDIKVVHTNNIWKHIKEYIRQAEGITCLFVNSTDMIHTIINNVGIHDSSYIFCAQKSANKLRLCYNFNNVSDEWEAGKMRKYNFFTGRFFNAFDLELDYKPNVLLLSDALRFPYSMLDMKTDCIQICGRFRNGINSVMHMYTTKFTLEPTTIDNAVNWLNKKGTDYYTLKNLYEKLCTLEARAVVSEAMSAMGFHKYINPDDSINYFGLDQYVYDQVANGRYSNQQYINGAYSGSYFFKPFFENIYDKNGEIVKFILSRCNNVKKKHREMLQILSRLTDSVYDMSVKREMRSIDPTFVDAYDLLGKEKIEELKYNEKKIKAEMIIKKKRSTAVIELVKNEFKLNTFYENSAIRKKLSTIYEQTGIPHDGTVSPCKLKDYFKVREHRTKKYRGYIPIRHLF